MPRNIALLHEALLDHLTYDLAKDMYSATNHDKYTSVVLSVREQLVENWILTQQTYYNLDVKRVYYLSLEFLLGRLLRNYIINLNMHDDYYRAVDVLGMSLLDIVEHEWDAGLGNGGLGRLAACFIDSLATLQYPAYGYGIRYEYGIFTQKIMDGWQVESPDNWLRYGNAWEFPRPEVIYNVRFYGRVNTITSGGGKYRMEWVDGDEVMAMAYDYPVPGFRNKTVNTLRLWSAKSTREFNLDYFNSGDYIKAMESKSESESISKVLYPNDTSLAGKELRLKQQYFFVSATIKDIIRRFKKFHHSFKEFPDEVAIQLNDTHPSIAIPELMRILVDEELLAWDDAWEITKKTISYTNHTVLPEALEIWSEGLFAHLLPRHLQIIQEINRRFMIAVDERFPNEDWRKEQMSIITGWDQKFIHMARLSIVGSHTINGVSELHSQILKDKVFKNFYEMYPERFTNVTNGITPRRWLLQANFGLSKLITSAIGEKWMTNLDELRKLEQFAEDKEFVRRFAQAKQFNKEFLAKYIKKTCDIEINPNFMLDSQVKRFHEYKRQLLNLLHVITLYNRIREGKDNGHYPPRVVLFSGKSAPAYYICKLIIKLIHNVSQAIANDPLVSKKLQLVFVPNYGVTLAQRIIPASELSEQISTAGYEASGTGNMKFTLNGALTIGTLDGANVEIRQEVGEENFFLFGLTAEEIFALRPHYNPYHYYESNPELKQCIDQIGSGYFSPENTNLFKPLVDSLLGYDRFFVLADYESYIKCQERVGETYLDEKKWNKMAILNVARVGKFSSDRAINEYAQNIWHIREVPL
ncbi:MAG: glycogen/starch/alpha-glucan phosphorylase [Thermodesulfovibrionales bacterium]|nr:glycogen/starch/alpha-glucan phosphorylase [Thermodesulfovibrionales bacterium]